jgi:hypothetical protein
MAEQNAEQITVGECYALASQLNLLRGDQSMSNRIARLEAESRLASRVITAMLRQCHYSDVFRLADEQTLTQRPLPFPETD